MDYYFVKALRKNVIIDDDFNELNTGIQDENGFNGENEFICVKTIDDKRESYLAKYIIDANGYYHDISHLSIIIDGYTRNGIFADKPHYIFYPSEVKHMDTIENNIRSRK